MWQSVEILTVLNTLTLQQIFCITKIFYKKLEYGFLLKVLRLKTHHFPYKTSMSEINVQTNRMGSTNGPITKNVLLSVTILIFRKFCFSLITSYKRVDLMYQHLNAIFILSYFRKRWSLNGEYFSPCEYP